MVGRNGRRGMNAVQRVAGVTKSAFELVVQTTHVLDEAMKYQTATNKHVIFRRTAFGHNGAVGTTAHNRATQVRAVQISKLYLYVF